MISASINGVAFISANFKALKHFSWLKPILKAIKYPIKVKGSVKGASIVNCAHKKTRNTIIDWIIDEFCNWLLLKTGDRKIYIERKQRA